MRFVVFVAIVSAVVAGCTQDIPNSAASTALRTSLVLQNDLPLIAVRSNCTSSGIQVRG